MFKKLVVKTALLIGPNSTVLNDGQLELRPKEIHKRAAEYALGCSLKAISWREDPFVWRGAAEVDATPAKSFIGDAYQNYSQYPPLCLDHLSPQAAARVALQFKLGSPAYGLWRNALDCADLHYQPHADTELVVAALTGKYLESCQQLAVNIEKLLCLRDPREAPLLTTQQWAKANRKTEAQPA